MFWVTASLRTPVIRRTESSAKWYSEVLFVSLRKPASHSQRTDVAVLSLSETQLPNLYIAPHISALYRHR